MESLSQIAKRRGTDKYEHRYCDLYEEVLGPLRSAEIKFLEIGIYKGASVLMWRDFFPNADLHAADISFRLSRRALEGIKGLTVHMLDCDFQTELDAFVAKGMRFDAIVDDGGHTMRQQQFALKKLWPAVVPGGVFIMEDLHTSLYELYPSHNLDRQPTTLKMVEALEKGEMFSSHYVSVEEFEAIASEVESAKVYWTRDEDNAKSITSVIRKRST